ncbi:hypothetical protein QF048_007411 [Streptomyces sp. W4I9-2]|nr:hypothetical protein [Streptomyces sp. W4I9-2]
MGIPRSGRSVLLRNCLLAVRRVWMLCPAYRLLWRITGGQWWSGRKSGWPAGTGVRLARRANATRSAVTAPLLQVRLLLPELADAAQHAVQAAYDMRAVESTAALQEARERALQAADDLVTAAGTALAA